jgi:hypothetical protein|tara:strand:+ start:343 stop:591 length:249 start_codon:yes stop_codon:yes gene_type:complete
MVKDQLKTMYTTLLNNHVQLLELLHEETKGKGLNENEDLLDFFNQLMVYLGSMRRLIFSPEEIAEKDHLKKELIEKLGINQA